MLTTPTDDASPKKMGSEKEKWTNFVRYHVQLAKKLVFNSLIGHTLSEAQTIVLDYLDGYMTWCTYDKRKKFKNLFMTMTTYGDEEFLKYDTVDVSKRPVDEKEAKKNLYSFLTLWRALFSIAESIAHCPNRLAQIYHWEITNSGPLWCMCLDPNNTQISFTEEDISDFYQDGLKVLEKRKVNFDDINDSANHRISESSTSGGSKTPRPKKWIRKTFYEPEGIWAFVVALRNYYPIIFFNSYLTLIAWVWFKIEDIELPLVLAIDGAICVFGAILEVVSRLSVYPCFECVKCKLGFENILIQFVVYVLGIAEIGGWFLLTKTKIVPVGLVKYACLGALGCSIILRGFNNMILFANFPTSKKIHYHLRGTTFGKKSKMLWKLLLFFSISTGILVPLYYWFAVPTLQRSAFWNFCSDFVLTTKIQCYIGIVGLWVPLLAIILIMNFISYTCVLGFFGAYLARANKVEYTVDESFSILSGFRRFSSLLSEWTVKKPQISESELNIESIEFEKIKGKIDEDENTTSKRSGDSRIFVTLTDASQVEGQIGAMYKIWYMIVDDMIETDLISREIASSLYSAFSWHDLPLSSSVKKMIQFFFSSLSSLSEKELRMLSNQSNYLDKMPGVTQLIPSYGEAIIFDIKYLCNRDRKDVTNIEFLVIKNKKEWKYFYERMKSYYPEKRNFFENADELLDAFVSNSDALDPTLVEEIRLWASFRAQTIYRTIRGTLSYRVALRVIFEVTNRSQLLIPYRCQVILAHQQYGDPSVLKHIADDIRILYKKLSSPRILGADRYGDTPFDLVFDWNPKDLLVQKSFLMKLAMQENEEAIKRYTLKAIHREQETVCAYGDSLKKLIDAKCTDFTIDTKFGFPHASIKAGLPMATRIKGKVWLLKYNRRDTDEFDDIERKDDSDDEQDNYEKYTLKKSESLKWDHIATGNCVVHNEPNIRDRAWLRVFNSETGREFEFNIFSHLFEARPISFYSWSGKETDALRDRIYCVLKFGIKTDNKCKFYALVSSLFDLEGQYNRGDDVQDSPIVETDNRSSLEITNIRRSLTHPRKYRISDFDVPDSLSYKSMLKVLDVFLDYSIEGSLSKSSGPAKQDDIFLGIQVYEVLPRRNPLILRVRGELPFSEPDRIQGKASNQMNGLRFSYGLVIQTKDANQGGSISEAIKFPIIIRRFGFHESAASRTSKSRFIPPAIIGFRENIFTKTQGSVARYQSYAEWAFVTIVQRVLYKLGIRMHYGHPDFFDATWVFSRSSINKANPVYNLSEDIFAGYTALLNNRRSYHTDEIQDEKGRDTSLASTYTFTAKLAQGAASQMKCRDIFEINTKLDFVRQFLLFHSSIGYYFTTAIMLASVKMYLFGLLVFTMAGYSAENLGNLQFIYSVPFLVQVGIFTLLPLILEKAVEEGFWEVIKVIADSPFSLGYFLFHGQTTSHHAIESFIKGKSHYEATGRLIGLSRKPLVEMYQLYGKSHFEPALDYLFYSIVYYILSLSREGGYIPLIAPAICIAVFIIAPSAFQVSQSYKGMLDDVSNFGRWVFSNESYSVLLKEWKHGPIKEQIIKNLTWKATFKTSHNRLQTYSIFNNLKNVLNTHWRVDVVTIVTTLFKFIVWLFITLSIPGTMKDNVLKVLGGFIIYIFVNIGIAGVTPKHKKDCWNSFTNIIFAFTIAYFVVLFIIFESWRYVLDLIVGLFLTLKILKSVSTFTFHIYAWVNKVRTASKWKRIDRKLEKQKIAPEERDRLTKELKTILENKMLAGLYLVDSVDRPFVLLSIVLIFIPSHVLFNIIWCIPYISEFFMYFTVLKSRRPPRTIRRFMSFWGSNGGYNALASSSEIDELPEFDFEDELEGII